MVTATSTMQFHEFGSRSEASLALARMIAGALGDALRARSRATFVASGGGSPQETYEHLGRNAIDWRSISVLPSDERFVPKDSPRHNLGMIRKTLKVPATYSELNSETDIDSLCPFDVALFGMGDDGHTASLFPDDPDIDAALGSKASTHQAHVPSLPEARISLTPGALHGAGVLCLLMFGAHKRMVFEAACEPGAAREYPVRILLRELAARLHVFWAA